MVHDEHMVADVLYHGEVVCDEEVGNEGVDMDVVDEDRDKQRCSGLKSSVEKLGSS
jgi:hypothetical protein